MKTETGIVSAVFFSVSCLRTSLDFLLNVILLSSSVFPFVVCSILMGKRAHIDFKKCLSTLFECSGYVRVAQCTHRELFIVMLHRLIDALNDGISIEWHRIASNAGCKAL